MLKTIAWLIKVSAFAVIVLIVGNYFRIGNKTVSDQIKTQLSHAERSDVLDEVKDWAHRVTTEQKNGIVKKTKAERSEAFDAAPSASSEKTQEAAVETAVPRVSAKTKILPRISKVQPHAVKTASEEIPASERQKLKNLMRELNSARETN